VKRQRRDEEALARGMEEDDEEEKLAEEKLRHLQEFAEKSLSEESKGNQSSTSSCLTKACTMSSWQHISNLMLYTAAGVKSSNKVGAVLNKQLMKNILDMRQDWV